MTITYLTLEQILVIHQDQIDRYGGIHGIRDLALLESALFRPQTSFAEADLYPDIFAKAASLIHSIILNHPFIDGNKRTGIVSGIIFLMLNETFLKVEQSALVEATLNIESKKWDVKTISDWLRENC